MYACMHACMDVCMYASMHTHRRSESDAATEFSVPICSELRSWALHAVRQPPIRDLFSAALLGSGVSFHWCSQVVAFRD